MNQHGTPGEGQEAGPKSSGSKPALSRGVTSGIGVMVFILVWFGLAGRVGWWQGWTFLLFFLLFSGALFWRLSVVNPDLARERNQPAERAEPWDRVVMGIYTIFLVILLVLAALDGGRFRWSAVPWWVQLLGWAFLLAAGKMIWHVMMINAYLSSWARIQHDRNQVVIQEGLYRYIRHPMYLGIIVCFLGLPLALNSWWSLVPSAIIAGLFVVRTYREDQMLQAGLEGYTAYSQEVRYRLIPGVW